MGVSDHAKEKFVMGGHKPRAENPKKSPFHLRSMRYSHKVEGRDVDDGEDADQEEELQAIAADKLLQGRLVDSDFLIPGMEGLEAAAAEGDGARKKAKAGAQSLLEPDPAQLEKIDKDFRAATDDQKLKLLAKDSPELLRLLEEYKTHMHTVRDVLAPLLTKVKRKELRTSAGMSFLQMKFHLLLLYCMHIVFYMTLKVEGQPVKDHPVIQRLVELRVYLQKLLPLEKKLKHTIERLLASAAVDPDALDGTQRLPDADDAEAMLRPRLQTLQPLPGQAAAVAERAADADGLYKAPKDITRVDDEVTKRKKERRTAEKLKATIEAYEDANYKPYTATREERRLLKIAEKNDQQTLRDCVQKEEGFEGQAAEMDDEDVAMLQFLERSRRSVENLRKRQGEALADEARQALSRQGIEDEEEITSDDGMEGGEAGEDGEEGAKGAEEDLDEDPFYQKERLKVEAKKLKAAEAKKREREEMETQINEEGQAHKRRAASRTILKNRGLTNNGKKGMHPRMGIKHRYQKLEKKRSGQVKEFKEAQYNTYAGERKISDHVVRGTKLS